MDHHLEIRQSNLPRPRKMTAAVYSLSGFSTARDAHSKTAAIFFSVSPSYFPLSSPGVGA